MHYAHISKVISFVDVDGTLPKFMYTILVYLFGACYQTSIFTFIVMAQIQESEEGRGWNKEILVACSKVQNMHCTQLQLISFHI